MKGHIAEKYALEVLDLTGLLPKANIKAGVLNLLDRKRLEMARALAAKPKLLLLDEIAGGLTEAECSTLIDTIKAVQKSGTTILWIEHVVHALLAVVDKIIVIDFGRKVAEGEPNAIMASAEVKEIYLGIDPDV
jgi:branched-chain amino acid transport system ATP-binding protein